jgi:hypothetical protein
MDMNVRYIQANVSGPLSHVFDYIPTQLSLMRALGRVPYEFTLSPFPAQALLHYTSDTTHWQAESGNRCLSVFLIQYRYI